MPLWAIRDWNHWREHKERFIESYNNVCTVFEKSRIFLKCWVMVFITEDRACAEQPYLEGDIRIFVNFSESLPFELKELSYTIPAKGFT